jgi:hypothetical protein
MDDRLTIFAHACLTLIKAIEKQDRHKGGKRTWLERSLPTALHLWPARVIATTRGAGSDPVDIAHRTQGDL